MYRGIEVMEPYAWRPPELGNEAQQCLNVIIRLSSSAIVPFSHRFYALSSEEVRITVKAVELTEASWYVVPFPAAGVL
jgi:hypothetical protein